MEKTVLSNRLDITDKGAVTVAATSTLVLAEDPRRGWLSLYNKSDDPAETVWLGFGKAAVVGEGLPIGPECPATVFKPNEGIYCGAIYAISESGTPSLAYQILTLNA